MKLNIYTGRYSSRRAIALLLPFLLAAAQAAEPGQPPAQPDPNPAAVRPARPAEDKEQVARRLASVETLIETSSAAKQIERSGNAQALELRNKARELRKQADVAYKAENVSEASRLLDQAAKRLFEGVRLAAPEQVTGAGKASEFDTRMESVKALLVAQKRISAEKQQSAKGRDVSDRVETQMREAAALAAAGNVEQGRILLDQAYVTTRLAIEKLREGDTLVRSLNFASKEEEYHYEIDRNDTHKMLVKMLLDGKRASNPGLDSIVQQYLEKSAGLRKSAEASAAKSDFASGIAQLEDSTKELIRAIRSAGVYIPG